MFTAEIEHETTKLRVTPETQPNSALITRELRRGGANNKHIRTTNSEYQTTINSKAKNKQIRINYKHNYNFH